MADQRVHCQYVSVSSEPHNLTDAGGSREAFVADLFSLVCIAQVDFNGGHLGRDCFEGIIKAKACMGEGCRVNNYAIIC